MDAEVYHSAKFAEYAKKKLVLVRVDFPRKIELPAELKKANEALKTKYAVKGFPTTVILDSNGRKLGQKVGYPPGSGPDKFIAEIDKIAGS